MKSAIEWGAIIQDPGSEYTSFEGIAKAIQDDATSTLKSKLAEVEECLRWASENVWAIRRWVDDGSWSAYYDDSNHSTSPTLYEALHKAWEGREK